MRMEGVWGILVPYEQAMQIIVDSWDLVTYNLFSYRAFTELGFNKSALTNTGLTHCWFTPIVRYLNLKRVEVLDWPLFSSTYKNFSSVC